MHDDPTVPDRPDGHLTPIERDRLAELESVVDQGLQAFIDVGNALMSIRDQRLYRDEHGTFEAYLEARWGWKRRTGYTYIDAATVAANVQTSAHLGLSQAAELASLSPDEQRDIAEVVANLTVAETREIVHDYKEHGKFQEREWREEWARRDAERDARLAARQPEPQQPTPLSALVEQHVPESDQYRLGLAPRQITVRIGRKQKRVDKLTPGDLRQLANEAAQQASSYRASADRYDQDAKQLADLADRLETRLETNEDVGGLVIEIEKWLADHPEENDDAEEDDDENGGA